MSIRKTNVAITYNSYITASQKQQLKMNALSQIFYCNVADKCWDCYGRVYDIKVGRKGTKSEWRHINVNNSKIGIDKLPVKVKIFDFDDFVFYYAFTNLCQTHPCPAMGFYVYRKMAGKSISLVNYFNQFGKNEKPQ